MGSVAQPVCPVVLSDPHLGSAWAGLTQNPLTRYFQRSWIGGVGRMAGHEVRRWDSTGEGELGVCVGDGDTSFSGAGWSYPRVQFQREVRFKGFGNFWKNAKRKGDCLTWKWKNQVKV